MSEDISESTKKCPSGRFFDVWKPMNAFFCPLCPLFEKTGLKQAYSVNFPQNPPKVLHMSKKITTFARKMRASQVKDELFNKNNNEKVQFGLHFRLRHF